MRVEAMPSLRAGTYDVVVVGAGVLGAWTAFYLRQRGLKTLLVDAWEPGHLRGSSSGETRVIRTGYGARRLYTRWAWQALAQWKHWEQVWGTELFHRLGVLWLHEAESEYTRESLAALAEEGIPVERIVPDDLPVRYPQISPTGIGFAYLEPEAGVVMARRAVQAVIKAFVKAEGEWQLGRVQPPNYSTHRNRQLDEIRLVDGTKLAAASFVFACGAWLPELFPEQLANFLRVTKQEVFFFRPPAENAHFHAGALPVWMDGDFYGIPALGRSGFKVADGGLGPPFEPTLGERVASAEGTARARQHLALRFPAMKDRPLVEAQVC
ncbi:FAD-dependent oxidoreductase [Acidobacteriia bacterium AH_259_A11_L15]|nr:FAD-dependent oxidoreductase [Acidobacteriia bacterium AH_259_A11_L15]